MNPIISRIAHHQPNEFTETPIASAVLVMLITNNGIPYDVLLSQRPEIFSSYPGDICFPGGIKESTDQDLKQTILRETQEEIGLVISPQSIIGQLDDFKDRQGRLVRPYVAVIDRAQLNNIKLAKEEVKQIIFFPLNNLQYFQLDDANIKPSKRKPCYIFQNDSILIWGLTAAILVHLKNVITETNYPVGHSCNI